MWPPNGFIAYFLIPIKKVLIYFFGGIFWATKFYHWAIDFCHSDVSFLLGRVDFYLCDSKLSIFDRLLPPWQKVEVGCWHIFVRGDNFLSPLTKNDQLLTKNYQLLTQCYHSGRTVITLYHSDNLLQILTKCYQKLTYFYQILT